MWPRVFWSHPPIALMYINVGNKQLPWIHIQHTSHQHMSMYSHHTLGTYKPSKLYSCLTHFAHGFKGRRRVLVATQVRESPSHIPQEHHLNTNHIVTCCHHRTLHYIILLYHYTSKFSITHTHNVIHYSLECLG